VTRGPESPGLSPSNGLVVAVVAVVEVVDELDDVVAR
jgi:hypothetical protein